jgi:hypothetical protein
MIGAKIILLPLRCASWRNVGPWFRSSRTREAREAKQMFFRRSHFLTSEAIRLRHCPRSHCISRTIVLPMQVDCKLLPNRFSMRRDCGLE